jgi:hypothetical protein
MHVGEGAVGRRVAFVTGMRGFAQGIERRESVDAAWWLVCSWHASERLRSDAWVSRPWGLYSFVLWRDVVT